MKDYLFLTIISLFIWNTPLLSQIAPQDVAVDSILSSLIAENVLNERGSAFIQSEMTDDRVEKAKLLKQLQLAFTYDIYFRTGFITYMKEIQRLTLEGTLNKEEIEAKAASTMAMAEGPKLERAVIYSDSADLMKNGFTFYMGLSGPRGDESVNLIGATMSAFGGTRTRLLDRLQAVGLIDQSLANKITAELKSGTIKSEADLLEFAALETELTTMYPRTVSSINKLAKRLTDVAYFSDTALADFLPAREPYVAAGDLLIRGKRAVTFRFADLPMDDVAAYQALFTALDEASDLIDLRDLKVNAEKFPLPNAPEYGKRKVTVSFTGGGRSYQRQTTDDYWPREDDQGFQHIYIQQDMLNAINLYLADNNSDYRLQYATLVDAPPGTPDERFALVFMTEQELDIWRSVEYMDFVEWVDFNNQLTTDRREALFTELANNGLLVHISEGDLPAVRTQFLNAPATTAGELLVTIPDLLYYFEGEMYGLESPYRDLTKELAGLSRGYFQPTNVIDKFAVDFEAENETTTFGFTYRGKTYSAELPIRRDWYAPGTIDLINEAVQAHHEAKFYYVDTYLAFLTNNQFIYLKSRFPEFFEYAD